MKLCLLIFLSIMIAMSAGCSQSSPPTLANSSGTVAPTPQLPNTCPKLAGSYEAIGKPLPGSPSFYRVRAWPLSMVRMLGLAAPSNIEQLAAKSEIVQNDNLELILWRKDGQRDRHLLIHANDAVSCDQKVLTIIRERDTAAEGTRVHVRDTRSFSRVDDGSLRLDVKIEPTSKFLWMIPIGMPVEEYQAVFASFVN